MANPREQRPVCYHTAAMPLMPPTPVKLVPSLLRARGLEVSLKRIQDALRSGAILGAREQWRWTLTVEDVDTIERYFRTLNGTSGGQKAGSAAVEEAKRRSRQSRGPC
jgi:hypothetical protein